MNRTKRAIGRLAAVGAVALVLTGTGAATTEAKDRGAIVLQTMGWCELMGGNSYQYEFFVWGSGCMFPDNTYISEVIDDTYGG